VIFTNSYARRGNFFAANMSMFYWKLFGLFAPETLNSSYKLNDKNFNTGYLKTAYTLSWAYISTG